MIFPMVERAEEVVLDCCDGIENVVPPLPNFSCKWFHKHVFSTVFQMRRGFHIQPQFLGYITYDRPSHCSSSGVVAGAELSDSSGHACVSLCNIF